MTILLVTSPCKQKVLSNWLIIHQLSIELSTCIDTFSILLGICHSAYLLILGTIPARNPSLKNPYTNYFEFEESDYVRSSICSSFCDMDIFLISFKQPLTAWFSLIIWGQKLYEMLNSRYHSGHFFLSIKQTKSLPTKIIDNYFPNTFASFHTI